MKRAIVVGGGGAKGAYAVGAVKHLKRELGINFDIVVGTSTGALMAPLIVADEVEQLEEFYTTLTGPDIIKENSDADVLGGSFYSTKPLHNLLKRVITNELAEKIVASPTQCVVSAVNLNNANLVYFHTGEPPEYRMDDHVEFRKVEGRNRLIFGVLASASIPIMMT
ncbi:MAG: hypothetical protein HKN21_03590, partial [Candidatus Eisenbacteria bacterium]|nr:hypothetical protein [Candidatus Eisenbacteria bacterium]